MTNGPVATGQKQNVNSILIHITRHLKLLIPFSQQTTSFLKLTLDSFSFARKCMYPLWPSVQSVHCATSHHGRNRKTCCTSGLNRKQVRSECIPSTRQAPVLHLSYDSLNRSNAVKIVGSLMPVTECYGYTGIAFRRSCLGNAGRDQRV